MSAAIEQKNQDATCYVGNLDDKVNEELLWELMLQAGPIVSVHMPKDKVSGKHLGYGFAEYRSEEDADYAIKVLNMIKLYGKPIKVNKASQDKKVLDIGANIFVGNLDSSVDEKLLYDTFSAFGMITQTPKIMLDPETGASKGYAFISYDSFESSDLAIECMNGQWLCNRQIIVQYAFRKDTPGERHGTQAERILATNQTRIKPNALFAGAPVEGSVPPPLPMMTPGMPPPPPPLPTGFAFPPNPMLMPQMPGFGYGIPPPPPNMPTMPPMMPFMAGGLIPPPPPPPQNY